MPLNSVNVINVSNAILINWKHISVYQTLSPHQAPGYSCNCSYSISSIRRRGYYISGACSCLATIRGQHLFLQKPHRPQQWMDKVFMSNTVTTVTHCTRNLSVLLSALGRSCTTQTPLALAHCPSRDMLHINS